MPLLARVLPAVAVLSLSVVPAAIAQRVGNVEIRARVAGSDAPLPNAVVTLRGLGMVAVTNQSGIATFGGVPEGARVVEIRHLGYETYLERLNVHALTVARRSVDLRVQPIRLAEVEVVARPTALARNGFFVRQAAGFGTFLTRRDIEPLNPRFLSDVLRRIGGISFRPSVGGTARAAFTRSGRSGSGCAIQYFIDGIEAAFYNIDDMRPNDVEGIEIYKGAATVPAAFNRGTALCGVIVIWTRDPNTASR